MARSFESTIEVITGITIVDLYQLVDEAAKKVSELIVYQGNRDIFIEPSSEKCYLYRVGSGQVQGRKFLRINNASRLNSLAEEVRDEYCQWIYSFNSRFLNARFTFQNLSLFFLTDLSCKRTEFFDTYHNICNLLLIRESFQHIELKKVQLIGVDRGFCRAIRSMYPDAKILLSSPRTGGARQSTRLGADGLYLFRLFGVAVINLFDNRTDLRDSKTIEKIFYSVYPQMFTKLGNDTKYRSFVGETASYAVSIVTDGMHQAVSIVDYCKFRREVMSKGLMLIDRFLRIGDFGTGIYWIARTQWYLLRSRRQLFVFKHIDITELISIELRYSLSRIVRLCTIMGMFRRFLNATSPGEIVYYPAEYPFGRMISYISNLVNPDIVRTGFQMSIVSRRRLEQFLAPNEASRVAPFLNNVPIPDRILAEDEAAADIYRRVGYKNVEIMEKVYRYEYLDSMIMEKRKGWVLIAPGLHDGELMLDALNPKIQNSPHNTYVLKPHPRADNTYVTRCKKLPNVRVMNNPIYELLGIVSEVMVTYSSVGVEAKRLGLPVTIIDVDGRVNTSPLLDSPVNILAS